MVPPNTPISTIPINVEILFIEGCPNHRAALDAVRAVAQAPNIQITITQTRVQNAAEAERLRYPGSPTVRAVGVDVEPAARNRAGFSFGCRRYKRGGVPAANDLQETFLERVRRRAEHMTDDGESAR